MSFRLLSRNVLFVPGMMGLLILLCTLPLAGQQLTNLKGSVKSESGETLPGVNIVLNDNAYGTVTDSNGNFELKKIVPDGYQMQVSFMGYVTLLVPVEINAGPNQVQNLTLKEQNLELGFVEVRGKSVTTRINEQAYSVTSRSTIELLNSPANVQDVLAQMPGVRILEDGGLGAATSFSINGFSGDQVKFFMDGLPMDNFGASLSLGDIPVNMIERIDVYSGVVPVWLGTDALGGAVNIVTSKKQNFLDLSYTLASFNTHKASVNFAQTHPESGLMLRGNAFVNSSRNNYRVWVPITDENYTVVDTAEVERFHDRYRSATLKLEAGWVNRSFADQLLVGLISSSNTNQLQHGATMATVYGGIERKSQSVIPTFRLQKNDWIIDGFDVRLYSALNFTTADVLDTLSGVRYNWRGEAFESNSTDGEFLRTFTTLDEQEWLNQLNAGYAINHGHSFALNGSYSRYSRSAFDRENPNYLPNRFPRMLRKQVLGLAYQWDPMEALSATLFGKYYRLEAASSKLIDFGLATQRTEAVQSTKQNFGYGMAGTYFPVASLQLKVSYEHTYRMPSPLELFGDGLFVNPNADLGPEQSDNLNVSATKDFTWKSDHRLSLGSTLLWRSSKDLIYTVVQVASPVTHYDNLSQTRTMGFESNIQYSWRELLHVGAHLTFQDITDQAPQVYNESYTGTGWQKNFHYGFRLPNKPYLFGGVNAGLTVHPKVMAGGKVNFNYRFNYVENYYLTWSKNVKYVIPRQFSHDLIVAFSTQNGKYNVAAECRNLFDTRLYDKYFLQKPGRAFSIKMRYTL